MNSASRVAMNATNSKTCENIGGKTFSMSLSLPRAYTMLG